MELRSVLVRSGISAEEAVNMMETLAALEAEAAMLAARRMPPSERDALEQVHTASESAARDLDSTAYIAFNKQFHELIYAGTRNAYLADLIRQTRLRMSFYHSSSLNQSARVTLSWQEHSAVVAAIRSEEHTSELQSLMRISYAVFCLKKK